MEILRTRSKNLQGKVSGDMKRGHAGIKEIINILGFRLESRGDASHFKRKSEKTEEENLTLKARLEFMEKELIMLKEENKQLNNKLQEIADKDLDRVMEGRRQERAIKGNLEKGVEFPYFLNKSKHTRELEIEQMESSIFTERERFKKLLTPERHEERVNSRNQETNSVLYGLVQQVRNLADAVSELKKDIRKVKEDEMENRGKVEHQYPRKEDRDKKGNRVKMKKTYAESVNKSKPDGVIRIVENRLLDKQLIVKRVNPLDNEREASHMEATQEETFGDARSTRKKLGFRNRVQTDRNRIRAPRSAAVMISGSRDGPAMAELLSTARNKINIAEMGINQLKIRRAATGGTLIEITGDDMKEKAYQLCAKLREVLPAETRITVPTKNGTVRMYGFDSSINKADIEEMVVTKTMCTRDECNVSDIIELKNGSHVAWIKCPLATAILLANQRKISIGWTIARLEIQESNPIQCFKCWYYGHMKNNCTSNISRDNVCYKCGARDEHKAKDCTGRPWCVICAERGKDAAHRMG